ncbi:glycoside hydrolase family 13 protein [Alteribacter lacisalsi]|uniref:glycoside hydrolase family 13 protein n=1 Tax=Alteribacter lacisalsi TaxID=2045244 RepID=UPI00268826AC
MTAKWWDKAVVYQVYPRSFKDANGDGVGDLQGILSKLGYLQKLGIDVIWLSPVFASPMKDNGYDISDYRDIASEFGTLEEMDELIAEADKRGIKIIMDLVINHSSDQHEWFKESKSSRTNPKRDWYIWEDPVDGRPPNNLRSIFGGSCWTYDEGTEQYYFHSFAKEQPDLNWENPEVRSALFGMVNWWLDRGIGGFRVDAITFIKKQPVHENQEPDSFDGTAIVSPNQPGVGTFLQEMKDETFAKYDIFTVAEAPGVSSEELGEFAGEDGYFDMVISFDHMDLELNEGAKWYPKKEWKLTDFKNAITKDQQVIKEGGTTALYMENHDQPRSLSRFVAEKDHSVLTGKMLAATYFFLKGMPYIYQGQEIGMTNVKFDSLEEYDDISSHDQYTAAVREGYSEEVALDTLHRRSRDNARTPMQWDASENGGFTEGTPWLKANPNYSEINVEKALADPDSLFYFYQKLIALRKESAVSDIIQDGTYEQLLSESEDVFVYTRTLGERRLVVFSNFTDSEVEVDADTADAQVVLNNYQEAPQLGGTITLRPYETLVIDRIAK